MFNIITPEQAGISSKAVTKFIHKLQERGLYTHGILMMRGNDIFSECYWSPYTKESIHRMYSQTKSFVGIAIGLLEEEGKLCLDDTLASYFPENIHSPIDPWLASQTIRQTLLMQTTGQSGYWFTDDTAIDRTEHYFRTKVSTHPAGTFWEYDSPALKCCLPWWRSLPA
jgi:CubicO group peptidase (beta-lactamase class C family)